eukprot:TRINITY_DN48195_c0_g1_i2.p1 TRINITY_DN48195_c0_g1~~TRINITY_DN48195_c0_g1_i2.p1  ORF type:complete len:555 (-),score=99.10 TRINITY_DN48195_c0_g1_i2:83-1747(-)
MAQLDSRTLALESLQTSIVNDDAVRHRVLAKLFPCSCSPCCPCLPPSLTKVQDWLHGVLLAGVAASVACIVQMVYELAWGGPCVHSPLCYKQWISGICVLPSTVYFIKTIGQYDEQLREKKRRHQEEVEHLIDNINAQVSEMNELCRKVTENANEFAMGRFNDKLEYFQKFLKGVKVHYSDLYATDEMLQELRSFVVHWLRNFSGSMLNPESSPLLRGIEQELIRCTTPSQVCDAAIRRLSESRVAFSFQMPAGQPFLPHRQQQLALSGSSTTTASSGARELEEAGGVLVVSSVGPEGKCGMSWLRLTRGCQQRCERTRGSVDGMPLTIAWFCIYLRVLSRTHANLLACFILDIFLIAFELLSDRWTSFVLVIVNEICVGSMLACFEQINEIAQLEQQIHAYELRSVEVGQRRDEARRNWEKVQQLHDLWLYRTLPCLSIMGKIHSHLADEDMAFREACADGKNVADPRPEFLRLANESLDCLERKLGALEDWGKNGPLPDEWKQSVGKQLKGCEECKDVNELIGRLPIITSDLSILDTAPPSSFRSVQDPSSA